MNRLALCALALAACVACDRVDYIQITPDPLILKQANNEVWLSGKAMTHQGRQAERASIGWKSADPAIATVDAKGKVRPVKSGHTEIIATHGKVEARVGVDVLFVEKVTVAPSEVTVMEGGPPVELKAKAFDHTGRELSDRTPTYKSLDDKVVSMGQNAVFGLAPGEATVEVQVDGVKASVKVTVTRDPSGGKK